MPDNRHVSEDKSPAKYGCRKRIRKTILNIIDRAEGKADGKVDTFESKVSFSDGKSPYDPLGMYTGVPENEYEKPIQDADDL